VLSTGETVTNTSCESGTWNIKLKNYDTFYTPIVRNNSRENCNFCGCVVRNGVMYTITSTSLRVHKNNSAATVMHTRLLHDDIFPFRDLVSIDVDGTGKICVLDRLINRVTIFEIDSVTNQPIIFTTWGGLGTSASKTRFNRPSDIHIDINDRIWVTDAGNSCIKHFSNTGSWIKTVRLQSFVDNGLESCCMDSTGLLHVLCKDATVRVVNPATDSEEFTYSVQPGSTKIKTNYVRECVYVVSPNVVSKHFRSGEFFSNIVDNKLRATNLASVFQDEYRNVHITSTSNILKYNDRMVVLQLRASLSTSYLPLSNIIIDKEEFVQDWVYNKTFERIWDCIELFRDSLLYTSERPFVHPVHLKRDVVIGQNEIVTSMTVNRCITKLWENILTLLPYFRNK
jgi:hypothetical protein